MGHLPEWAASSPWVRPARGTLTGFATMGLSGKPLDMFVLHKALVAAWPLQGTARYMMCFDDVLK